MVLYCSPINMFLLQNFRTILKIVIKYLLTRSVLFHVSSDLVIDFLVLYFLSAVFQPCDGGFESKNVLLC